MLFSLFMYSTFFFYVFDFLANLLFPFVFEFLFSTQIRHYSLSNEATCSSFGGRRGDRPALWQSASYPDARKYLNDHLKMPLTSPSFCWSMDIQRSNIFFHFISINFKFSNAFTAHDCNNVTISSGDKKWKYILPCLYAVNYRATTKLSKIILENWNWIGEMRRPMRWLLQQQPGRYIYIL